MNNIYLFDGKAKLGPFSEEEIRQLSPAPGTLFWYEGLPKWLPIEKLTLLNYTQIIKPKREIDWGKIRLYWALTIFIFVTITAIYGAFFDEFSESELVEISFFWFGPLVFSITALIATYSKSKRAAFCGLIAALAGIFHLVLFYMGLWSAL